jgi:transketolase
MVLIAMGGVASEAQGAQKLLAHAGIDATLAIVASVSPAPTAELIGLLNRHRLALTVEAHYLVGGLGSLVAEIIAENNLACRLVRCGVARQLSGTTGSRNFMHTACGLTAEQLARTARVSL